MSKNKKTHILKHGEIHKKILSNPEKPRSPLEWFDALGKYRDEHVAEYNQKKAEFMEDAQRYSRMNLETMMCQKVRLNSNYEENLTLSFLKDKEHGSDGDCTPLCCCPKCEPNKTGRLLRRRSIRPMMSTPSQEEDICITEPWFRRHITLNKFIWAARTIIIQNRLLKILNRLKMLTLSDVRVIERTEFRKKCEDFHCHPVFEKFL